MTDAPHAPRRRSKVGEGIIGKCAALKEQLSIPELAPGEDPFLERLAPAMGGVRPKSVLVQPIQSSSGGDKVLGVLLAVNKREAEGEQDIFFEPFFTDADW